MQARKKRGSTAVFPVPPESVKSPDGRYEIVDTCTKQTRALSFKSRGARSSKRFYSYERNVDILWSPDSNYFALNDNMGSNVASALLYKVTNPSKPLIDLGDKLHSSLKPSKNLR